VRVQALIRGFLVRKHKKKRPEEEIHQKVKLQSREFHASGMVQPAGNLRGNMRIVFAKMLSTMPDFSNLRTMSTEQQLGPFNYDQDGQFAGEELLLRGPYELDNGSVYQGQWSKDGLRQGRGL
jgi:hypothetical protein